MSYVKRTERSDFFGNNFIAVALVQSAEFIFGYATITLPFNFVLSFKSIPGDNRGDTSIAPRTGDESPGRGLL